MKALNRVCIFCASSPGIHQDFFEEAKILAGELVRNNISVNYGGGSRGLMGTLADTMLEMGGSITGYIPHFMVEMEWAHPDVTNMVKVHDMHERKYLMRKNTDAVIALPGGVGTLEELMEVITLKQLGQFTKPVVLLNTNHFYDPLLTFLQNMVKQQFMRDIHKKLWQVAPSATDVLGAIMNAPAWNPDAIQFAAVDNKH